MARKGKEKNPRRKKTHGYQILNFRVAILNLDLKEASVQENSLSTLKDLQNSHTILLSFQFLGRESSPRNIQKTLSIFANKSTVTRVKSLRKQSTTSQRCPNNGEEGLLGVTFWKRAKRISPHLPI